MAVKERLLDFVTSLGVSVREFERCCGLYNGYVKGIKHSILPDKLRGISLQYPQLNTGWLLTGEGPMIKNTNTIEAPNAADAVSIPIEVWEVIKNQAESLKAKDDQNSQIIEILREQLKKTAIVAEKRRVANTVVVEVEE